MEERRESEGQKRGSNTEKRGARTGPALAVGWDLPAHRIVALCAVAEVVDVLELRGRQRVLEHDVLSTHTQV